MALVGVVVAAFSTQPIAWAVVAITLIGTALTYIGKNAIPALQSTTGPGTLSLVNLISGILVAIGSGITESIATLISVGHIQWDILGKVVLSVTMSYLGATLFAGPNTAISPGAKI